MTKSKKIMSSIDSDKMKKLMEVCVYNFGVDISSSYIFRQQIFMSLTRSVSLSSGFPRFNEGALITFTGSIFWCILNRMSWWGSYGDSLVILSSYFMQMSSGTRTVEINYLKVYLLSNFAPQWPVTCWFEEEL